METEPFFAWESAKSPLIGNLPFWDENRQTPLNFQNCRLFYGIRQHPWNFRKTWMGPHKKFPLKKWHLRTLGNFYQNNRDGNQKFQV